MVEPEVIIIPIIFGLPTIAFMVRSVLKHRERMAEMAARGLPSTSGLEERLARLEHTMDAIAIEMERVGEGQRFLTKVFAQQRELPGGASVASSPPRVITPH